MLSGIAFERVRGMPIDPMLAGKSPLIAITCQLSGNGSQRLACCSVNFYAADCNMRHCNLDSPMAHLPSMLCDWQSVNLHEGKCMNEWGKRDE